MQMFAFYLLIDINETSQVYRLLNDGDEQQAMEFDLYMYSVLAFGI